MHNLKNVRKNSQFLLLQIDYKEIHLFIWKNNRKIKLLFKNCQWNETTQKSIMKYKFVIETLAQFYKLMRRNILKLWSINNRNKQ